MGVPTDIMQAVRRGIVCVDQRQEIRTMSRPTRKTVLVAKFITGLLSFNYEVNKGTEKRKT
jgi:hypothetical protein